MSKHSDIPNQALRDEMGTEDVHSETAQLSKGELTTYSIVEYGPGYLPETYLPFVLSRWLRSLRYGNDYFRLIHPESYYKRYQAYLKPLLTAASVRLALLTNDRDVVLGFSVRRGNILDYVYVMPAQRYQGIARNLVPSSVDTITHLTKCGLVIWANRYPNLKFNPFV